jgi:hypothetical protein
VPPLDGSITTWGNSHWGGTGAPSDNDYTKIYSTWGASLSEGASVPPEPALPHAVIDPSALRAAKAPQVE